VELPQAGTSGSAILACTLSALAGGVLVILTFYPGLMNVDAWIQLAEARAQVYHDWHLPLMGRVWAVFDRVSPGPGGLLLLNNLMFWSGLALTTYLTRLPPLAAVVAILAVGLAPPVFSALGVVWKDVGMAAALLLAFALLWWARTRSSRVVLCLSMPFLLYGFALRHNAAPAVFPLVLWIPSIWQQVGQSQRPTTRRQLLLTGLMLFVLLGGTVLALNRLLTNGQRLYPTQQVLLHDLTAISVKTGQLHLPTSLKTNQPPTIEGLACLYTWHSAVALFSGNRDTCALRIKKIVDPPRMADLEAKWISTIFSHPGAYLEHRWNVFREQFAFDRARVCYPLQGGTAPNPLGIEFTGSLLFQSVQQLLTVAAYQTPLFRGWIYLTLTGMLVMIAVWGRNQAPLLVLSASGLFYSLAYLIVSTGCDFRFHWWSVVAAVVGLVVFAGTACGKTTAR
jgi:hypothetical protein